MSRSLLRIAHIDTEKSWRGGQQQVVSLIAGLSAAGHKNLAIVQKGGALSDRLPPGTESFPVSHRGEWDFISAHFVNRKLRSEKIDVVHAHSGHGVALAAIATLGTQIPIVVTRRVDFPLSQNVFSTWKYKRATQIVAISEGVRKILLQSGISQNKISVIPSGVDFHKFSTVKPVVKSEFGFPADSIIIGQVAALAPHKDQQTFLLAMSELKSRSNIRAVIVGDGPLRLELEKKISELGLQSHVRLLGFKENPLDYLASFDIFCLSSKEEGLGTSLLDAMALRIPVVATKAGGIPELIQHEKTGFLCEPRQPRLLAEAIETCLRSPKKEQILAQAMEKAKEFNISHTVSRMEELYRSILT